MTAVVVDKAKPPADPDATFKLTILVEEVDDGWVAVGRWENDVFPESRSPVYADRDQALLMAMHLAQVAKPKL